ncbi:MULTISPECIES: hypothetical protein [unclassified Pseudomonas]|nr:MULTISPECIES: hypothetical protein [unclassified Pseudomonas]
MPAKNHAARPFHHSAIAMVDEKSIGYAPRSTLRSELLFVPGLTRVALHKIYRALRQSLASHSCRATNQEGAAMAVRLKKLQGSEIPEEQRHLGEEEIFQVVTADDQQHFFASEVEAAAKVAQLIDSERDQNA